MPMFSSLPQTSSHSGMSDLAFSLGLVAARSPTDLVLNSRTLRPLTYSFASLDPS